MRHSQKVLKGAFFRGYSPALAWWRLPLSDCAAHLEKRPATLISCPAWCG